MRGTTFRGKRVEYGEWVYGYLIGDDTIVGNIVEFTDEYFNTSFWYKVRPNTVGEFTGVQDRNGKEIYEGDVVNVQQMLVETAVPYRAVVEWDKYRFAIRNLDKPEYHYGIYPINNLDRFMMSFEVIGNIYDKPELTGLKAIEPSA